MRPITTNARTASYSKDTQLGRVELDLKDDGDGRGEAPVKRRRTQSTSVAVKVNELEALLAQDWDPDQLWDSDSSRLKAERLRAAVGTGYQNATQSLITQTGQYCAYCDAPLCSGLKAEPMLPADWFPTVAFDYENLLLECAPCHEAKQRNLSRASGSAAVLSKPNTLAWPQLFAQTLVGGALLPFRYDMVRLDWVLGTASGPQPVNDRLSELLQLYRRGYVRVDRSDAERPGGVQVQPPGEEPYEIALWVSATSTNRAIEAGVRKMIEVLKLNVVSDAESNEGLDRRLELRTMACFKALDFADRMNTVLARGDFDQINRMVDLWKYTIQGTGFWGVWLSVFRDQPQIQERLAGFMPGTFQQLWTL